MYSAGTRSFVQIAVLDLAYETALSIKQSIGRVSNCCGGAPSLVLIDRHRVLPSSGFSPEGLRGVKKTIGLPSLVSLPPAMSPVSRIELMLKEQPLCNTNFQIVCKSDVTHQLRRCHIPTSVSLNCTNIHQGTFVNSRSIRTS